MKGENASTLRAVTQIKTDASPVHPAWRAFIRYCVELKHGEIASLKIQDGLPVLAEVIREKIKFTT